MTYFICCTLTKVACVFIVKACCCVYPSVSDVAAAADRGIYGVAAAAATADRGMLQLLWGKRVCLLLLKYRRLLTKSD